LPSFKPLPTPAVTALAAAWLVVLAACPSSTPEFTPAEPPRSDAGGLSTDAGVPADAGPGGKESCDLQALMALPENGCTNAGCHGAQYQGGLDLASPGVEQRLIGARSQTTACRGEPLVDATNVDNSLLLRMVDPGRFAAAPCGVMMPLGKAKPVSDASLSCFEAWVKGLASGDSKPGDAPAPFEAVAPQSYLSKVKTLLTGKAPSADEIASVSQDQAALARLVSGWVDSAEYASKLREFFSVALQQRLDGSLDAQFSGLKGSRVAALKANLAESFVRTASALVADDRPFTEILTTRRWAATTATLSALAFLDNSSAALRVKEHTVIVGTGTDSVEARTWYRASVRADCTPKSPIDGAAMFDFMLGFANCTVAPGIRFADTILGDADFADWRMVELETASPTAEAPIFYDVGSLRGVTSLSLRQPRLGFFTSPAFLANWETNEDNQFRVTTSQTLIVALGELFSPADPTQPVRLDGLASEHATPGSTCYGCHQFLDPMRAYFARDFSFDYQGLTKRGTTTPSFAFQGQTHDGGTLVDFARALAAHPRFATGWTQKLCFWANSQACDEEDPEFKRVAATFASSGFNFKRLVVALMSSPLVTGASQTTSSSTTAPIVSITRKQHLCQLLNVRLGIDNACEVAAAFASLVPEDDFSRGSAEPVQSAVTGLFHFAAAEKLCLRLATKLVGNGPTVRFAANQPAVALDSFVHDLMGLGIGHPRSDAMRARLEAHYASALAATTAVNALRSAFTIACMSPEVMAVGL
jgi:hypothetical protein